MHKKITYRTGIVFTWIFIFQIISVSATWAQCAMCRGAAETSVESGSMAATGINMAVIYLLAITFAMLFVLAFIAWKYRNRFSSI